MFLAPENYLFKVGRLTEVSVLGQFYGSEFTAQSLVLRFGSLKLQEFNLVFPIYNSSLVFIPFPSILFSN